jgi:large subunit ribosomal protein L17
MKKKIFGRKLSRERASREALFVSLVENFILNGKITTTKAKAKAVVGLIDGLVVLSKKTTLGARRLILKKVRGNTKVLAKLSKEAENFKDRIGGYTKLIPLPNRKGDMAKMVRIEWVKNKNENLSTKKEGN